MQRKKSVARVLHVRLFDADWQAIYKASERLDLAVSEIARRALRIGLNTMQKAVLPGKREVLSE